MSDVFFVENIPKILYIDEATPSEVKEHEKAIIKYLMPDPTIHHSALAKHVYEYNLLKEEL